MSPSRSGNRLVVVDDSPTALRLMESVLTQAGYDVTCLERGADAVSVIRRTLPQIAFLDTSLVDVDIRDVCKEISDDDDLGGVAVVLMTTRTDGHADRVSAVARVTDHITKPFTPDALLALIEHLISRAGQGFGKRTGGQGAAPIDPARVLATVMAEQIEVDKRTQTLAIDRLTAALSDPKLAAEVWVAARELPGTPCLAGDIALVPLPDILQALAYQRQTGILSAERGAMRIDVAYKDGAVRLVVGDNVGPEFLLGNILVREGFIAPQELELVLQNRHGTTKRLGRQVVQLGYVAVDDLRRALLHQSSELIYELLRWRSGRFAFRQSDDLPVEVLEFDLGVRMEALLMEGFRRVDEWGLIETVLPSFDIVPVRVPGGLAHMGTLTPEEQRIYDKVDGRRRARDIIEAAGTGAFEVARVLYRLISAHIITMEQQQGVHAAPADGTLIS